MNVENFHWAFLLLDFDSETTILFDSLQDFLEPKEICEDI